MNINRERKRVVLITGASGGVGISLSRYFLAKGDAVAAAFCNSKHELLTLVSEYKNIQLFQADLKYEESAKTLVEDVLSSFGAVDVLINCAGMSCDASFLEMSGQEWSEVLAVNLSGSFFICQGVAQHMVSNGGGIILNISAITGQIARKNAANYCSSKAGLDMLSKCIATELGPEVRSNALALGFIDSPLVDELYGKEELEAVLGQTPAARFGSYNDVCKAADFLTSEDSDFITGQTIVLDGGRIAHRHIGSL